MNLNAFSWTWFYKCSEYPRWIAWDQITTLQIVKTVSLVQWFYLIKKC